MSKKEVVIKNTTIRITNADSIDDKTKELLSDANNYLEKFKDYNKAYSLFNKVIKKTPFVSDAYLGILRCITKDFSVFNQTDEKEILNMYNKYISLTNYNELKDKEEEFINLRKKYNRHKMIMSIIYFIVLFILVIAMILYIKGLVV